MKNLEFPIVGTKSLKDTSSARKFDLSSPKGRSEYFEDKAGREIAILANFLKNNTFIAYMLGKKNSGKGTYSKLFTEVFGEDKVATVSVGDLVRDTHSNWDEFAKSDKFDRLKKLYRGYMSFEDAVDAFTGRSQSKLLPTEFILALLKLHLESLDKKSVFIDGLPRDMDQISYSLYFRDLINYRDDPDVFVLIDIPETVIDQRIKYRVICPECHTSRSLKFFITSNVEYDKDENKFYLRCDNPNCSGPRMVGKEGDELGIEPIRDRLVKDEAILRSVFGLHGVPKVLLRNHIPVSEANKYFDEYEFSPEYIFEYDDKKDKVIISEKPWSLKDDNGVEVYSLMAPPVAVGLIKQLVEALEL